MNGTTSNFSVDSTRVNAALLATDSQQTRSSQIPRRYDSPVSSWPPTNHAEHPYGPARHNRRRGKLKIERINDNHAQRCKTTHLRRAHGAQSPDIPSKRCDRVVAPIHQRDRIKFEPTRVSQARNGKTTHLARAHAVQPHGNSPKRSYRVIGPRRRRGRLKPRPTNVSRTPEDEKTYQGLHKPILPYHAMRAIPRDPRPSDIFNMAFRSLKKNLQNVSRDDDKSIASSTHPSANTSISARRDLPNRVTTLQSLKPSHQQASNSRATDYIHLESLSTHSFDL